MGGAMLIGYARTSTLDQVAGFEAQRRDLEAAGCQKILRSRSVASAIEFSSKRRWITSARGISW
jgi:DNA invertase Pin-like site-specific DNA recombinase